MNLVNLFWLFLILASLQPVIQQRLLELSRQRTLARLASERGSTVITLIHRQETMSFLGFPVVRYIDIDDAQSVLGAIRATPPGRPIDIILHTPGGMVLAASQIASALAEHDGPVRAIVPHYAMSGGTLIALAADEINLDPHTALGPVDPQLGEYPAASIVAAAEQARDPDDRTLILADMSRKALWQVERFVGGLLERHMDPARAREVARVLSSGTWTHDYPLEPDELISLGLPVKVGIDPAVYTLMKLYPQPKGRRESVEYVPSPIQPPRQPRRSVPARGSRDG
ncbi:SDH family Clp fold serine proteinase [Rubrobacter naiadicus]|uniref:SDH family Clp fold serine proteinase n=1 Tax=Rubrobacter naiadicus TaxID=1392641 RepID=UPI0023615960|nr:ATP-dependent Clp protease proteolytic subunit [Rubrobacter naiadicus]